MPASAQAIGRSIILAQHATAGIHVTMWGCARRARDGARASVATPRRVFGSSHSLNALRATAAGEHGKPGHVIIREVLMVIDQRLDCGQKHPIPHSD